MALAFGLTVLTGAYAFGHISGGHFNPAVSCWPVGRGRFPAKGFVALRRGAGTRCGVCRLDSVPDRQWYGRVCHRLERGAFATNGFGEHSRWLRHCCGILCEVVMTAMFLIIIMGATHSRAPAGFAPIAIGLGLTLIHLYQHPGHQHLGKPGALIGL